MDIDIFALYEDLRAYFGCEFDDAFYDAAEGGAQYDIVITMLEQLINKLKR